MYKNFTQTRKASIQEDDYKKKTAILRQILMFVSNFYLNQVLQDWMGLQQ